MARIRRLWRARWRSDELECQTVLFAGGAVEYRHYVMEDPSFLTERKDTQYDLTSA